MHRKHRHLIRVQFVTLTGLALLSLGSQGVQFVAQYLPLLITVALIIVSLRLCVKIVQTVDPHYKHRRAGYMHGSMLPILVFEPEY